MFCFEETFLRSHAEQSMRIKHKAEPVTTDCALQVNGQWIA